jgi:hypothetical protein
MTGALRASNPGMSMLRALFTALLLAPALPAGAAELTADERLAAALGPAAPAARVEPVVHRLGGYRAPTGPTRDQTSPVGLEIQVGGMSREVYEYQPDGSRFEFDVSSERALVKLTLRPASFFELYGLGGGADLDSGFDEANFSTGFDLAYGGGARVTLYRQQPHDTAFFLEGRYLRHETEGTGEFDPDPDAAGDELRFDEEVRWEEWEGRAGISWRFYLTRPYVGIRYSGAEAKDIIGPEGGPNERRTMRATKHVGGFVGLDIYFDPSRRLGVTAEVSFPDTVTGHFGLRYWF